MEYMKSISKEKYMNNITQMKRGKNLDLISVIVPVYKVEKYLDRCVESIVNQTYKNLEIIFIKHNLSTTNSFKNNKVY